MFLIIFIMLSSLIHQEYILLNVFKLGYIFIAIVTYLMNTPTFSSYTSDHLYLLQIFTWGDLASGLLSFCLSN